MAQGAVTPVELHHRVQLGLVKAAELQLAPGGNAADVEETLARLVEFTRVHFEAEELLMRVHRYPHVDAHAATHARLMKDATAIRTAHAAGNSAAARGVVSQLRTALLDHVAAMDAAFDVWCSRNDVVLE